MCKYWSKDEKTTKEKTKQRLAPEFRWKTKNRSFKIFCYSIERWCEQWHDQLNECTNWWLFTKLQLWAIVELSSSPVDNSVSCKQNLDESVESRFSSLTHRNKRKTNSPKVWNREWLNVWLMRNQGGCQAWPALILFVKARSQWKVLHLRSR